MGDDCRAASPTTASGRLRRRKRLPTSDRADRADSPTAGNVTHRGRATADWTLPREGSAAAGWDGHRVPGAAHQAAADRGNQGAAEVSHPGRRGRGPVRARDAGAGGLESSEHRGGNRRGRGRWHAIPGDGIRGRDRPVNACPPRRAAIRGGRVRDRPAGRRRCRRGPPARDHSSRHQAVEPDLGRRGRTGGGYRQGARLRPGAAGGRVRRRRAHELGPNHGHSKVHGAPNSAPTAARSMPGRTSTPWARRSTGCSPAKRHLRARGSIRLPRW